MAGEIIKCERISHPPVRFIGKRYTQYPNWNDFWANNWFEEIEKAGKQAEVNDGSYCVLTGFGPEGIDFYLGEFFPQNTLVPEGFDHADLPAMDAGLFYIRGTVDECYGVVMNRRDEMMSELAKNGMAVTQGDEPIRWVSFERDNCPRLTDPDEYGNVILDYAIYLGT
jgi:hypothetical protein